MPTIPTPALIALVADLTASIVLIVLTPELAAELDSDVRARLFSRADANLNDKIASIDWNTTKLGIKTQIVQMRMAPDQNLESFTLAEAAVGKKIKTNQNSDGKSWRCRFTLTVHPASEHQSAQILESFGKVRYCAFEDRQPDLFSLSTEKRTKAVRAERAQGIGAGASATH